MSAVFIHDLLGVDFMPGQSSDIRAHLSIAAAINQPWLSGGLTCQLLPELQPLEVILVNGLAGFDLQRRQSGSMVNQQVYLVS